MKHSTADIQNILDIYQNQKPIWELYGIFVISTFNLNGISVELLDRNFEQQYNLIHPGCFK